MALVTIQSTGHLQYQLMVSLWPFATFVNIFKVKVSLTISLASNKLISGSTCRKEIGDMPRKTKSIRLPCSSLLFHNLFLQNRRGAHTSLDACFVDP